MGCGGAHVIGEVVRSLSGAVGPMQHRRLRTLETEVSARILAPGTKSNVRAQESWPRIPSSIKRLVRTRVRAGGTAFPMMTDSWVRVTAASKRK